jgi:beta-glucosidase
LDSEYPPARPAKGSTPEYSQKIPPAAEVAWSSAHFTRIWRYLYPYLALPQLITASDNYPYPDGYTTQPKPAPRAGGAQGGNPALFDTAFSIQVQVKNTGTRPAKAVAQLYVALPSSLGPDTPPLQLRQFEKTKELAPGQSETLTLDITRKDLSIWDVVVQDWKAPVHGDGVKIWVGQSVEDLPIVCEVGGKCSTE